MRCGRLLWVLGSSLQLLGCPGRGALDASSDASAESPDAPTLFESRVLFEGNTEGYPTYRIPALLESPSGALLAFCEGRRSLQDDGDIDLVLRRSEDDGRTWSPLRVVVDLGADTAGNPAPVVDRSTGRVWLPFSSNPGARPTERHVWLTYSDDDGLHWASPRELTAEVSAPGERWYATGPGRSVQLRSGRLLVPCNHTDAAGSHAAHTIYSDDHGATWRRGGSLSEGTDESQAAQLADGTVLMASRFEGGPFARAFSRSRDEGATWSAAAFENDLPDPRCQGSLLATEEGLWLSNPATREPFPRDHLTVRLSLDQGASWAYSRVLDAGPSAYSSLAALRDGRLAIAWESGAVLPYNRIRFAAFARAWVAHP